MPGVLPSTYTKRLFKVQSGQETTWGTPVVATAKWMAVKPYPSFKPMFKSTGYDEDRGGLAQFYNSNVLAQGVNWQVDWEYATYEEMLFAAFNTIQAVTPTGGGPYTYTFLSPTTAVNSLTPFTLEYAYDIATVQYYGNLSQKLTIKGEAEKQWDVSISGFGKGFNLFNPANIASSTNATPIVITTSVALPASMVTGSQVVISGHLVNTAANGEWTITKTGASTFSLTGSTGNGVGAGTGTYTQVETPALADRTVNAIITPGMTLAIDPAGVTPGTTSVPNALLSWQIDYSNGLKPIYGADSLQPVAYSWDKVSVDLTLELLLNAQVKALVNNSMANGTGQVIQLKQTSGTSSCEIDFAGILTDDPEEWGSKEGAASVSLKLSSRYDTGSLANQFKMIVINGVSALP